MAINYDLFSAMIENINISKININDIHMCELGNQLIRPDTFKNKEIKAIEIKHIRSSKDLFCNIGVKEHISIDLNGKDGALALDLSKRIQGYDNYFNVVTNIGTSEHVKNQYYCFMNISNFCRPGGLIIHSLPLIGHKITKHGRTYYYSPEFFSSLYRDGYKILYNNKKRMNKTDFMFVSVLKTKDNSFISEEEFNKIKGAKIGP